MLNNLPVLQRGTLQPAALLLNPQARPSCKPQLCLLRPASARNSLQLRMVVEKRVLFRSSSLAVLAGHTSDGSPAPDGADSCKQAAESSKSFTFGSSLGQTATSPQRSSSSGESAYTEPLLGVVDGVGSSPVLLEAVAGALEGNVERFEVMAHMLPAMSGEQSGSSAARKLTMFHGVRQPPITIPAYLERLAKYTRCSPVCFVMAMCYLDRVVERDADCAPSPLNVHRLLLTGVMTAAKFVDDHYFNNAFYARVGGISVQELNRLELTMLQLLEWHLHLSTASIKLCLKLLLNGGLVLGSAEHREPSRETSGCGLASGNSIGRNSIGRKRRSLSGTLERRQSRRSSASSGAGGLSSGPHSVAGREDCGDDDDDGDGYDGEAEYEGTQGGGEGTRPSSGSILFRCGEEVSRRGRARSRSRERRRGCGGSSGGGTARSASISRARCEGEGSIVGGGGSTAGAGEDETLADDDSDNRLDDAEDVEDALMFDRDELGCAPAVPSAWSGGYSPMLQSSLGGGGMGTAAHAAVADSPVLGGVDSTPLQPLLEPKHSHGHSHNHSHGQSHGHSLNHGSYKGGFLEQPIASVLDLTALDRQPPTATQQSSRFQRQEKQQEQQHSHLSPDPLEECSGAPNSEMDTHPQLAATHQPPHQQGMHFAAGHDRQEQRQSPQLLPRHQLAHQHRPFSQRASRQSARARSLRPLRPLHAELSSELLSELQRPSSLPAESGLSNQLRSQKLNSRELNSRDLDAGELDSQPPRCKSASAALQRHSHSPPPAMAQALAGRVTNMGMSHSQLFTGHSGTISGSAGDMMDQQMRQRPRPLDVL